MRFSGNLPEVTGRVLVAEENARLRRIVCLNLEQAGLPALGVASAAECHEWLSRGGTSAVIISSQLPDFDARGLSSWLRSRSPDRPIPVILTSFEAEDQYLTLPLRLAAFSRKPFDPGDLAGQIGDLIRVA